MKRLFLILALALLLIILVLPVSATESTVVEDQFTLWVDVEGEVYSFDFASSVNTWDELKLLSFDKPGFGRCSFVETGGSIGLGVFKEDDPDGVFEYRYFLIDTAGFPVKTTDSLFKFTLSSSTNPFTVSTVCTGEHDFSVDESVADVPCGSTYEEIRMCRVCGYVTSVLLTGPDHKFESVILAPTCTEGGYHRYVCSVCSFVKEVGTYEPLGHDFSVLGSCRRKGCNAYTGDDIVDVAVDAWEGVTGWIGGIFDGDSSGENSSDDKSIGDKVLDLIDDLFTPNNTGNSFVDGANAIIRLIGVVFFAAFVLLIWKPLKAFFKTLARWIKSGAKFISSGIKKLRKRSKTKSKK